jgi:hypothetical protein
LTSVELEEDEAFTLPGFYTCIKERKYEMKKYIVHMGWYGVFVRRVRIENVSTYDIAGKIVNDYRENMYGDPPRTFDEEVLKKSETYDLQLIGGAKVGCILEVWVTDETHGIPGKKVYSSPKLGANKKMPWKKAFSKLPYRFVCDGELFIENDYSESGGYLTLEGFDNNSFVAEIMTEDEFDPSKLEIHYKKYLSSDGEIYFATEWIYYDGKKLIMDDSDIVPKGGYANERVKFAWVDSVEGRVAYKAVETKEFDEEGVVICKWQKRRKRKTSK